MATELVKPTSTATKPAVKAERLRSLKNRIARLCREARAGASRSFRRPDCRQLHPDHVDDMGTGIAEIAGIASLHSAMHRHGSQRPEHP
jgi:hypothetical protein